MQTIPRFFVSFFGYLKVGSLGSNNSEPKIFLSIFWYNLKVGSLFASDNSEPKIFLCYPNVGSLFVSENS